MRSVTYLSKKGTVTTSYAQALADGGVKRVSFETIEEKHNINQSEKAKAMRIKIS